MVDRSALGAAVLRIPLLPHLPDGPSWPVEWAGSEIAEVNAIGANKHKCKVYELENPANSMEFEVKEGEFGGLVDVSEAESTLGTAVDPRVKEAIGELLAHGD